MLPSRHIILSLPLGATVVVFTQSWFAGLLCVLSGILTDVDHFIEYIIHRGLKNFRPKQIYQVCRKLAYPEENTIDRLYLFFHAIEFAILLLGAYLFSQNIYLLAITLGYTGHLLLDITGNPLAPRAYFIGLRIKNSFSLKKSLKSS